MSDVLKDLVPEHAKRIRWTREQADRACGPIVYIFWAVEGTKRGAWYVGRSFHGIERPLSHTHHRAADGREKADEIEFICCASNAEAAALERKLIRHLRPILNKTDKALGRQLDANNEPIEPPRHPLPGIERDHPMLTKAALRQSIELDIAKDTFYSK